MNLNNFKPCKECRRFDECYKGVRCLATYDVHEASVSERIFNIFIYDDDCFEEVDDERV